jgi:hypothetical protein
MPIKITTVAVDCAAKATSVDNFLAEVVPVITQNFLKRLFCQRNTLRSWNQSMKKYRNYKGRDSKTLYELYFFYPDQKINGSPPFN